MKAFFTSPALYTSLAILSLFFGGLFAFIGSGIAETYYPDDPVQLALILGFILVPALALSALFFYIAKRLKRNEP